VSSREFDLTFSQALEAYQLEADEEAWNAVRRLEALAERDARQRAQALLLSARVQLVRGELGDALQRARAAVEAIAAADMGSARVADGMTVVADVLVATDDRGAASAARRSAAEAYEAAGRNPSSIVTRDLLDAHCYGALALADRHPERAQHMMRDARQLAVECDELETVAFIDARLRAYLS
jgi:hypothetical protein